MIHELLKIGQKNDTTQNTAQEFEIHFENATKHSHSTRCTFKVVITGRLQFFPKT